MAARLGFALRQNRQANILLREAIGFHDQGAVEEAAKAWVGKNKRHPPHGTSFPGTSLRLYKASKDEIYGDHSCYIALGYKRPELSVAAQYFVGVSGSGLEVGERRRRSTADVNPDFEFQMDDDTVLEPALVAEAAAAACAQLTTVLAAPADAEEINKAVANERPGAKTARISAAAAHAGAAHAAAAHAAAAHAPPALAAAADTRRGRPRAAGPRAGGAWPVELFGRRGGRASRDAGWAARQAAGRDARAAAAPREFKRFRTGDDARGYSLQPGRFKPGRWRRAMGCRGFSQQQQPLDWCERGPRSKDAAKNIGFSGFGRCGSRQCCARRGAAAESRTTTLQLAGVPDLRLPANPRVHAVDAWP